jgi:hypothetical protein
VPAEVLCTDNDARLEPVDDRIRPVQGVASTEVFPTLEMEELTFSRGTG